MGKNRHPKHQIMIYITGRKVDNPKKGLYIKNGKKVVLK